MHLPILWILLFAARQIYRHLEEGGSVGGRDIGLANVVAGALTLTVALPLSVAAADGVRSFERLGSIRFLLAPAILPAVVYAAFTLPHWLAWRVLGPWRWLPLGRGVLQAGVYRSAASRVGALVLYESRFRVAGEQEGGLHAAPVTPWTVAAAALVAERKGQQEEADRLFGLFAEERFRIRSWRRPAAVAGEVLAWNAVRDGSWERARRSAAAGWGRGLWLPRRLVERASGEPVTPFQLVVAWLAAPDRRGAFPWFRTAVSGPARGVAPRAPLAQGEAAAPASPGDASKREVARDQLTSKPHLAHLHLLERAAAGHPIAPRELEALADGWSLRAESEAAQAELLLRAAAIGASDPVSLPQELLSSVLSELELLLERVQGDWSVAEGSLAEALRRQALGSAHERVSRVIVEFTTAENSVAPTRLMASGLEELERWIDLRDAVEQLVRLGGQAALQAAWHSSLRTTACNWGVFVVRQRGEDANWAAYLMHCWCEELAAQVGDPEIEKLSRSNAKLTRSRLG